jgi:CubicO group peptidase (beta-lactamase class C family)
MRRRIFAPLGMNDTTFDFAKALRGNHASPHGDDVDGNTRVGRMDLNYAVVPARPAGGVWTSAHDFSRFVMMELAGGKAANGKRIVSTENLLARREPQVMVSADVTYGMGLFVNRRWGTPEVSHGGDLAGYHSDMIWLPEHDVGAVILTNADTGPFLRGPFMRKLVEVLFDGRPEADEQLRVSALQHKQNAAKERERLVLPADPAEAARLASRYVDAALGELIIRREGDKLVFDAGEWRSSVASRRNDDGTVSFITIDPTLAGFEFVVAERDGQRALLMRDAQHEYVFKEDAVKRVPRKPARKNAA